MRPSPVHREIRQTSIISFGVTRSCSRRNAIVLHNMPPCSSGAREEPCNRGRRGASWTPRYLHTTYRTYVSIRVCRQCMCTSLSFSFFNAYRILVFFFWHFVNRPLVKNNPGQAFFLQEWPSSTPYRRGFDRSRALHVTRGYFRARQQEMMDLSAVITTRAYCTDVRYTR